MEKPNILILIRRFDKKYPKHKHKYDMITALGKYANIKYWGKNSDIKTVLKKTKFKPDFILHYDFAWNYRYAPKITGLGKVKIPKGCFVIDTHYSIKKRKEYFNKNKIDVIFSVTKASFLKKFPEFKNKHRWIPFSINPEIFNDLKIQRDIDYLLMGQFYYVNRKNPPKRLPPKGRYMFREVVYKKFKNIKGFKFFPHPGHYAPPSNSLLVNDRYAYQLNKAKIFFTCGGSFKYPVAKFFEASACNTLLLAQGNNDIYDLGFKDRENFIECNYNNVLSKGVYYLKNEEERLRISRNGYELIHKYHTNEVRAQQFIDYIKEII